MLHSSLAVATLVSDLGRERMRWDMQLTLLLLLALKISLRGCRGAERRRNSVSNPE